MDIICAKCGKHFSSIETAREHHCKETSEGASVRWIPAPKSKITPEEWDSLMKLINPQDLPPPKAPSDVELTATESTISKDSAEPDVSRPSTNSEKSKRIPGKKEAVKNKREKKSNYKIQNWLIALLFIFAFCIIGLGVSIFVGSFIPLWLTFGFSFIYSIEKWFYYFTRKHKGLGKLYRLLLNLSILSLLGLIVWSGIKVFSQQFVHSQLIGSLVFLAELVLFVWMWRIVSKNSWRWPSMKLTGFSLICLFVIFAFAGVPPMSVYKDNLVRSWNTFQAEREEERKQIEEEQERAKPEPTPIKPIVPDIPKPESVLPEIEEPNTRNPSWEELKAFLLKDDTDKMKYVFPTTVCEDFAKELQKNAKEAGWRCAFVSVQLEGYPDWYNLGIPSYTGHACNAFETTDRGLIYIDCTSTIGPHPLHQDAIVDVKIGNDYIPRLIFPSQGWSSSAMSMGRIVEINTIRW